MSTLPITTNMTIPYNGYNHYQPTTYPNIQGTTPSTPSTVKFDVDCLNVGGVELDAKVLGKMLEYMIAEFKEKHPEEFI